MCYFDMLRLEKNGQKLAPIMCQALGYIIMNKTKFMPWGVISTEREKNQVNKFII